MSRFDTGGEYCKLHNMKRKDSSFSRSIGPSTRLNLDTLWYSPPVSDLGQTVRLLNLDFSMLERSNQAVCPKSGTGGEVKNHAPCQLEFIESQA
jgi:hypothetical protein